jgi:hypothetical protein
MKVEQRLGIRIIEQNQYCLAIRVERGDGSGLPGRQGRALLRGPGGAQKQAASAELSGGAFELTRSGKDTCVDARGRRRLGDHD